MTKKPKAPPAAYQIGKGRPPKASRWKPGQSGNPKGRAKRLPSEAELIERLFRRGYPVIERGENAIKTGFAIIHAQLLMKESSSHRRAGRTRDRYEAFARGHEGIGGVQLRYVDSGTPPIAGARSECGVDIKCRPQDAGAPAEMQPRGGRDSSAAAELQGGES